MFKWLQGWSARRDGSDNRVLDPSLVSCSDCTDWTKEENASMNMQTYYDKTLVLKRGLLRNSSGQIGALYDGEVFLCHILEDPSRDVKIYGETAIPAGTYQIEMNTEQGRAYKHGARWPWHLQEVFHLLGVKGFKYIQIHPGNRPVDTLGCLLPGEWNGRAMSVARSSIAYKRLYERYAPIARAGRLWIRIEE